MKHPFHSVDGKRAGMVTSVSVGGPMAYVASGELDVPPSALVS